MHTFLLLENVPDHFLPFGLVRLLMIYHLTRPLARLLNILNPFSDKDTFDRYARFIKQGDQASQEDILKGLMKYYPGDTKFVVLSVDMDYMEAGRAPLGFEEQIKELAALKKKKIQIISILLYVPIPEDLISLILLRDILRHKGSKVLNYILPWVFIHLMKDYIRCMSMQKRIKFPL